MRIHILGICGTFMGGIALIARQLGHDVCGSDENIYPPMSTALKAGGIKIFAGYNIQHLAEKPDLVIIGNALSRGNPMVEYVLNKNIPYTSGPAWLHHHVLQQRHVLAVAGTHGKTTTTTLLAWILTFAGLKPGYLIGGVPLGLPGSAILGESPYFVIEADEYDTAFFDKQSKFLHYHPRTLIINNLEYDHADIFADMEALRKQFVVLLRTVPGSGKVIYHSAAAEVQTVIDKGCWAVRELIGPQGAWRAKLLRPDGAKFSVFHHGDKVGEVNWSMIGEHNINNALAAMAAAHEIGVHASKILTALAEFPGVKRRLEVRGEVAGITVYDDFAHHPTAVAATLTALRHKVGQARIIAVLQFGSYTMKTGVHASLLTKALMAADRIILLKPSEDWDLSRLINDYAGSCKVCSTVSDIVHQLVPELRAGDHVLVMSNKGFGDIHNYLLTQLRRTHPVVPTGD